MHSWRAAALAVLGAAVMYTGAAAYAQGAATLVADGADACRAGLEPLQRAATGSLACVTPPTKAVLIERGWGADPSAPPSGNSEGEPAAGAPAADVPTAYGPAAGAPAASAGDAPGLGLTDDERAWLDENPVIYVAYEERPPIEYLGADGKIRGLAGIYAEYFEAHTGATLVPVRMDHRGLYSNAFRDNDAHLSFSIVETDELHKHSNILESHTILTWDVVTVNSTLGIGADGEEIEIGALERSSDVVVGTIRGHEIEDWLDTHHPHIEYVSIDGHDNAFDALLSGRIDALMETWIVAERIAAAWGIDGLRHLEASDASMPLSVAYNRAYPVLEGIIRKAMLSIPEDVRESHTREIIGDIAFKLDERARSGLTYTEAAWLRDNPTVYIAYTHWPPIEYASGDGDLEGLTAMYEERLEAYTGADFVPKKADTWTDVLSLVAENEGHISLIMVPTSDRLRGYTFTSPHSTLEWNIITRGEREVSTADLAEMRVGTIRGYSVEAWLDEHDAGIDYVSLDTIDRAIESLDSGRIDAVIEWWPAVSERAAELGVDGLHNAGAIEFGMPLSAAVAKDNVILRDILDKAIAAIPAEERASMLAAASQLGLQQ